MRKTEYDVNKRKEEKKWPKKLNSISSYLKTIKTYKSKSETFIVSK